MTDQAADRPPDFLLIGATKAGSASVGAYLRAHREVFLPGPEARPCLLEAPGGRLAAAGGARVVGEACDAYARHPVHPDVAERAAAIAPDARVVYLVREPFVRLTAHWRHRRSTGREWRPLGEAVEKDPSYLASSLYGLQLAEWRRFYPPERILVLRFERLLAEPKAVLTELCDHLGVEFDPRQPFRRRRGTRVRSPRDPGVEQDLPERLRAEVAALFEQDRPLLTELAGPQVARWPRPDRPQLRRVPGFSEEPAGWLGARLGLAPPGKPE